MTKINVNTGMVQYLSRKLLPLAMGIALLIAVLAPVTYWILEHHELQNMADIYAKDLADKLRQVALESPALWKYQTYKFITLTEGFHPAIEVSGFRVLDEKGEVIAGHDNHKISWERPEKGLSFKGDLYFTRGTAPIIFNDRQVGTVEVLADDTPIVRTTILLFIFCLLVGTGLALLVYRFPVIVVQKMTGKIEELIGNLRRSEDNYSRLNAELELKVAERTRELLAVQEELVRKEKLAIIGELSGSVGHELRNPLGVMSNAVYYLKMVHADADATTKEYLEIIQDEIDNSLRIITGMLDFARTRPPQRQSVSAGELVRQSLESFTLPENVTVTVDIPAAVPNLNVDPPQIGSVLSNFITNGVQAMPDGGALHIAARFDGDFVEISVTDNGEGITAENMKKLFQPLFSTRIKGIGLGLVVCKNLVKANGGRVRVESKPGKGTTFTVLLPVAMGKT